jgi:hypothetical protein
MTWSSDIYKACALSRMNLWQKFGNVSSSYWVHDKKVFFCAEPLGTLYNLSGTSL